MTEQTKQNRTPRNLETREAKVKAWQPPSLLPEPNEEPGYTFRWIRLSTLSKMDAKNMSSRFREGFEPVRAEDHPEMSLYAVADPRHKYVGCIENGGLLLCKIPNEFVQQRREYYAKQGSLEAQAVDNHLMRENDPRMPLLKPERRTEVTFGSGS